MLVSPITLLFTLVLFINNHFWWWLDVYDFFTHKSTKSLIKYNHMKRDTLYDNLKEFMLVARALSNSLLARVPSSAVSHELRQVADDFTAIFSEFGHLH